MDIHDYPHEWYITYHFVWAPMRAKACLHEEVARRLEALIAEKAAGLELVPARLVIEPDKVYLVVEAPPTLSPHQIVCQVKAFTSHALRDEFPELTRIPSLWTRSYIVLAGENVTAEEVLRRFEDTQPPRRPRGRPRKMHPPEHPDERIV